MADLQGSWQAFPKLRCFSPRISKESFGGFVEFQRVTKVKNPKRPSPNFFAATASFWTRCRRHRVAFRRPRAAGRVLSAGGRERLRGAVAKAGFIVEHRSGLREVLTNLAQIPISGKQMSSVFARDGSRIPGRRPRRKSRGDGRVSTRSSGSAGGE